MEQKNKRLRKELEECEVIEAREREETKKMETLNKDMKANRLKMNKAIVKLKIENIYAHYTEQGEQNNDLLAKQSADETAAFIQEKMNTLADLENSEQMKSLREDERTLQKANEELDKTNAEVKKLEEQIALLQIDNQRKETTLIVEMVAASMKLNATREEVSLRSIVM